MVTNFVGASAAPSHAPALKPHITPRRCMERGESLVMIGDGVLTG
jgi:hypothetical protein